MGRDYSKGFFDALSMRPDVIRAIRQVLLTCSNTKDPVPPIIKEVPNGNTGTTEAEDTTA